MKKIQIELSMYIWIYDYISEKSAQGETEAIMIKQKMDEKLDKILAHEEYTKKIKMYKGGKNEKN